MQATVHTFDEHTGAGQVISDEGVVVDFSAEVFWASGLLRLRPGQRLHLQLSADPATVTWMGLASKTTPGPS